MSKRGDLELLCDIKEAIERIVGYLSGIEYEQFLKDAKTQDAIVRNMEVIGEASKNISDELKKQRPQSPWKKLAGIRDRLIHHYFGVNFDIIWNIMKKELPDLIGEIDKLSKIKEQ